jgi:hypothetical protein
VEAVIVKTLTEKPHDATHWSTQGLAKSLGMSQPTGSRIWKAFGLKPWQEGTFKLSEDPLFVDKVRDIVGLYMNPPVRAVVICVDEKTAVQALDRTQPVLPLLPHRPERRSHDHKRHATIDFGRTRSRPRRTNRRHDARPQQAHETAPGFRPPATTAPTGKTLRRTGLETCHLQVLTP